MPIYGNILRIQPSIYEDIDNRDLFNRASYPVEIANICKQNLTFTITNKKAKD